MTYSPSDLDLTTVANFQYWLGSSNVNENDASQQQRLITSVSEYIQNWIGRTISAQPYTLIRDGNGGSKIVLPHYPVQSVTLVQIYDYIVPQTTDPTIAGWFLNPTSGCVSLIGGCYSRYGYNFVRGIQNVMIQYIAGYTSTPNDLEQACLELAGLRWKEKSRIGEVSKSIAGEVITFSQKDMPASVRTILEKYKEVIPL